MKKTNKKGFTIVELVIVIAVIAILAAVLIPTFSGVVKKAQKSAALQAARNTMTEYLASLDGEDFPATINLVVSGGTGYWFTVVGGVMNSTPYADAATALAAITNGAWGTAADAPYADTVKPVTITNP